MLSLSPLCFVVYTNYKMRAKCMIWSSSSGIVMNHAFFFLLSQVTTAILTLIPPLRTLTSGVLPLVRAQAGSRRDLPLPLGRGAVLKSPDSCHPGPNVGGLVHINSSSNLQTEEAGGLHLLRRWCALPTTQVSALVRDKT